MTGEVFAEMKMRKRVLVVTNDSTVFLVKGRLATPYDIFGGRVTEVKNLVKRLDTAVDDKGRKLCDVSFGVITTKYGFVPGNYQITDYPDVMSDADGYREADERRGFVEQTSFLTRPFDKTVMCVPNDMFAMFLEKGDIWDGRLIAVTSPKYREECERRGWNWLERRGARVGDANADEIERIIRSLRSQPSRGVLEFQQPSLQHGASGVASDATRRGDHPVAGDYQRDRIAGAHRSGGAECAGMPRLLRQFRIGAHLPVGDLRYRVHDVREELRALERHREVELPPPSGQVLVDLGRRLRQDTGLVLVHGLQVLVGQEQGRDVPVSVLGDADAADEGQEGMHVRPGHGTAHRRGWYLECARPNHYRETPL